MQLPLHAAQQYGIIKAINTLFITDIMAAHLHLFMQLVHTICVGNRYWKEEILVTRMYSLRVDCHQALTVDCRFKTKENKE